MRHFFFFIFFVLFSISAYCQKDFTVACIAFYNLENLFDTIDSPDTDDFEFTPYGSNVYNSSVYYDKLEKLSKVISELGAEVTPDGAALVGVSEIENRTVLEDLVRQPALKNRNYQILHHDSKDSRGVDVALLYQPKYFTPDTLIYHSLVTSDPGEELKYSRDILVAVGSLNGEQIAVSVNHWPSRRGGESRTAHLRNAAACFNKNILDSLIENNVADKTIVMGDLNDDPVNDSIRKGLRSKRETIDLGKDDMYNPLEDFYRKGLGTTAYRNAWSLFDQIIISESLVNDSSGYRFYKAAIHNPSYLVENSGIYKGYPFRSYSNGSYTGGYSDHFPVYILIIREKK